MKNELQIKRIGEFIDSLEYSELKDGQQAIVLNSELESIGGDNSRKCSNGQQGACGGVNTSCTNHGDCTGSTNKGPCKNPSGPPGVL